MFCFDLRITLRSEYRDTDSALVADGEFVRPDSFCSYSTPLTPAQYFGLGPTSPVPSHAKGCHPVPTLRSPLSARLTTISSSRVRS